MTTHRYIPLAEAAFLLGTYPEHVRRLVCTRRVVGELRDGRWLVSATDVARIVAAGAVPDRPARRGVTIHRPAGLAAA